MERIHIVRTPQEVKPFIQKLNEVLVSEVTENTDLSNAYICGDIVGHSTSDDGSSLLLTIQGDGLQFTTVFRGEAANQYPDATTGGTIYLYRGTINKSEPEWSQASGFQLVIDDSSGTNVILLHKNIKELKRLVPCAFFFFLYIPVYTFSGAGYICFCPFPSLSPLLSLLLF